MADEIVENSEIIEKKKTTLDIIMEWSLARKLSLVAAAVISVVLFSFIIMQSQVADYNLLFANMPNRDAAQVVDWLKGHKIPYRLADGGRDILIPADKVYEARIELAGSGLANGGVGFEIFDKQSIGMTDFAQKINYRRALQGELMRTITSLAPVAAARVHLALPEKRLFREQQQPATASIIIKLASGRSLKKSQLEGIIQLVAGSVEGLESENVIVVDSSGKALSKRGGDDITGPATPGMLGYQQTIEKRLEVSAQSLLDRALGAGNSLVRVNVEVDFDQREKVEEALDPKGAVIVSEQSSTEEGSGEVASGVPGVVSNLNPQTAAETKTTPASRSEETVNYELSKVVRKTVESVGTLNKLSVSVLVADRVIPGVDGEKPSNSPRTAEELQEIEKMVRTALGINAQRGDLISVISMPFESGFIDEALPQPSLLDRVYQFMPLIKYALLALASLLAYFLLIRPILKTMRGAVVETETEPMKTVEELERELSGGEQKTLIGGPDDPLAQIRQEVLGGDMLPVQVIKNWLREEPAES